MSIAIDVAFDRLRDHVTRQLEKHGPEAVNHKDSYMLGYQTSFLSSFIRDLPIQYQDKFLHAVSQRTGYQEAQGELDRIEKSIRAELDALDLSSEDR
jgi:hypothetical protein